MLLHLTKTMIYLQTDEVEGWEMEEISTIPAYYPGNIKMGEIYKFLGSDTYELYDVIYKRVKK